MRATLKAKTADSPRRRADGRGVWPLAYPCALLAALVALGLAAIAPAVARAQTAGSATLTIQRPSSGPVGAHIVASVKNFSAGHTYALGYESQSDCLSFTPIPDAATFTVKNDTTAIFTFVWPATDTGTYNICARDTASAFSIPIKSNNQFVVLGTRAPAIQVTSAPGDSGTPTPTSNDTYYPGSEIQV
ncbi:MAG TPA: hypothetical protein VID73_11765, partial [Ktedonobacterales bacterium]